MLSVQFLSQAFRELSLLCCRQTLEMMNDKEEILFARIIMLVNIQ